MSTTPRMHALPTDSGTAYITSDEVRVYLTLPALDCDQFDSVIDMDLDDLHSTVTAMFAERDTTTIHSFRKDDS